MLCIYVHVCPISQILLYVLDIAGSEGRDPITDFHTLQAELELYARGLTLRPSLIFANKTDLTPRYARMCRRLFLSGLSVLSDFFFFPSDSHHGESRWSLNRSYMKI
jgi:hypothetical protein